MNASLYKLRKKERIAKVAAALAALIGQTPLARAAESTATTPLPEVVVTGEGEKAGSYNPPASGIPKLQQPLVDTPQTITVVPEKVIKDQNATSLRDTLRNVTGLSLSAGEGGAQGDSMTLRGFPARGDLFLDGMRDFGNYTRDPFNLEQVEVLKGGSSLLFGRGTTGGVVNQTSKAPTLAPSAEGALTMGTDATARATADINQKLPALGEKTAIRLNVMAHQNNVAERDVTEARRFSFAPSLGFGIGTSSRLSLSYLHQNENNIPDYGLPLLFDEVAPADRNAYFGFASSNFQRTRADVLTLRAETELSESLKLREQFRAGSYGRVLQTSAPRLAGGTTPSTPISSIQVNRSQVTVDSKETILDNDLSVTATFRLAGAKNTLAIGTEAIHETSTPNRTTYTGVATTPLESPNPFEPFSGTGALSSSVNAAVSTLAFYGTDTLELNRFLQVNGGLRVDHLASRYEQYVGTPARFTRVDNLVSWRAGAVAKPEENGSVYFSYGTSFNPSAESISLSATTVNLDPEKNRSIELGTKWELNDGKLSVAAALFRDEKTNARTPDPINPTQTVLTGKIRSQGLELGGTGRLTSSWQLFAGYTFLHTEVLETNRAGELHNKLANAPAHTLNVWTTWTPTDVLELGGGARSLTRRTTTTTPNATTNQVPEVPGYTTVDAMARYQVSQKISVQANFNNIFNTYYFDSVYAGHVVPGAGRSVLLMTSFRM